MTEAKSDNALKAEDLIKRFGLEPHPEGGHYRRTYQSPVIMKSWPDTFIASRPSATAIIYLLQKGEKSRWHRLRQDEMWHFYGGRRLRLAMISSQGVYEEVEMGSNLRLCQQIQVLVPAGYWFAARPANSEADLVEPDYSLVGCTVSPGFDFADFELAEIKELEKSFPHLSLRLGDFT